MDGIDGSARGGDGVLRLVVIGDSTAFTTDRGPALPQDPQLYPNVVAAVLRRALGRRVAVSVLAHAGLDSRDAYRMTTKDRHVQFEVLMGADAVVVGIGSFDHAPSGIPPVLEELVAYLRPASLRRGARTVLRTLHPHLARLTGSRFSRTPLGEFERLYGGLLFQVRALTQGAAGVVMGPTGHNTRYFGPGHPNRVDRERRQFSIAERHGFPSVACWPFVEPHVGRLNPDGIHWPPDVHAAVGEGLAVPLIAQIRGEAPKPPVPAMGEAP